MTSAMNSSEESNGPVYQILRSRILLDEDLANILLYYTSDDETISEPQLSMTKKLITSFSLASTVFLICKKFDVWCLTISASPILCLGLERVSNILYKRKQQKNVRELIEILYSSSRMNHAIVEYLKLRNLSSSGIIVDPLTKPMKQLIEIVFQEEVAVLYVFKKYIRELGLLVPALAVDYAHLDNIDLEQFFTSDINNINDYISELQKLCDIFVLMASSTLTCLGVTLCSRMSSANINVNNILDTIVPELKKECGRCYNKVNKSFDDVKYYYLNRNKKIKKPVRSQYSASSRLCQGTYNVMAHTSEILEKSQAILEKLEKHKIQTLCEKQVLSSCISELRGQVLDYYESLDVLHKLFEVNIEQSMPRMMSTIDTSSSSDSGEPDCFFKKEFRDASLFPSEPSDDEEYEAYVGANDSSSEITSINFYEEQESRKYASLLSQELKHKLKAHEKFIAARKKRGIIDEELENAEAGPAQPEPAPEPEKPKFELYHLFPILPNPPSPIRVPNPLPNCDDFNAPRKLAPPPPPPPLPPIDLGPYGDMAGSPYTVVDDFLESVKAASAAQKRTEEVFECNLEDE